MARMARLTAARALPPKAPRVGSVPKPRGVMQVVFLWGQGLSYGDRIASVKFSLAERLPIIVPSEREEAEK